MAQIMNGIGTMSEGESMIVKGVGGGTERMCIQNPRPQLECIVGKNRKHAAV